MGPHFLDRQSLWYMFCCNFICLLFIIQYSFFGHPNTGYQKWPDIRCNPNSIKYITLVFVIELNKPPYSR